MTFLHIFPTAVVLVLWLKPVLIKPNICYLKLEHWGQMVSSRVSTKQPTSCITTFLFSCINKPEQCPSIRVFFSKETSSFTPANKPQRIALLRASCQRNKLHKHLGLIFGFPLDCKLHKRTSSSGHTARMKMEKCLLRDLYEVFNIFKIQREHVSYYPRRH